METNHEYRSEALGAIHETMTALEAISAISKVTMREFDAACLQPVPELAPEAIRALRTFCHHLKPGGLPGNVAQKKGVRIHRSPR